MDMLARTTYEAFPNKPYYREGDEQLLFNEPASTEFESWLKLFQGAPQGVIARKVEEEVAQRKAAEELLKQREDERLSRSPEPDAWMPDDYCKTCFKCEEPFTLIKRRHHCRICFLVFCGSCSSHYLQGHNFGYGNVSIRVCDNCYEIRNKKLDSSGSQLPKRRSAGDGSARTLVSASSGVDESHHTADRDEDVDEVISAATPDNDDERDDLDGHLDIMDEVMSNPVDMDQSQVGELRSRDRPRLTMLSTSEVGLLTPNTPSLHMRAMIALRKREDSLLESLLEDQDVHWKDTIIRLAKEASDTVRPDAVLSGDLLDIREYVRIQLIPGSTPQTSMKVDGAVLRRNAIDRFMPIAKERPKIMLLESGIELNRDPSRIIAFEKLLEQERLYLDMVVKKVSQAKVDVLLVGGSVSSVAHELLRDSGIAVASLVPLKDLQWLSRLTGAAILPTPEYISRLVNHTGTCDSWRCETVDIAAPPNGSLTCPSHRSNPFLDTFMVFEGCHVTRGCTLVLRGENFAGLEMKAVLLSDILKRLWTLRLDHAFLVAMDADEAIARGRSEDFYGDFLPADNVGDKTDTTSKSILVLKSDTIDVGRVWLQHSTQQHSVPEVTTRSFYGIRDRAFGDFLLRYCFDSKKLNNNMADGNYCMVFLHGHGQMRVSAERLARADVADFTALRVGLDIDDRLRILTWAVCRQCGEQTNVKALDPLVMNMSFAKWLQNVFYLGGLKNSARACDHSLMHEHLRFFFRGDFVVTVDYETSPPLSFNSIDRLDLKDATWYRLCADQLAEEFLAMLGEVRSAFENAPLRQSMVNDRLDRLRLTLVACRDASDEKSFTPSIVNHLFRDLFVSCVDWNSLISNPQIEQQLTPAQPSPRASGSTLKSFPSGSSAHETSRLISSRFSNLSGEPRLKRRPSLPEIQEARTKVMGKRASAEDSGDNLPLDAQSEVTSTPTVTKSMSQVPLTAQRSTSTSSSTSSFSALLSQSAPPVTPAMSKKKPVPLPSRLMEGHLLLPPGRRLDYPVIPVRESEPTSWIAHALGSDEYSSKLSTILGGNTSSGDWERLLLSLSRGNPLSSEDPQVVSEEGMHIQCGFTDASEYSVRQCAFSVRCFYAAHFHALRLLYAKRGWDTDEKTLERRFVESLSRCSIWKPSGGKSRATFLKTRDDRFIVKSVSQEEFEMFQELAPKYFTHLANVLGARGSPSTLVPFLGLFSMSMQSEVVMGKRYKSGGLGNVHNKLLVVVSPNIFWGKKPKIMYDLKGNARNRLVRNPEEGAVRLDVNFFQDNRGVPIPLHPEAKETLSKAVSNDAAFLSSVGVVDYSLLVGIEESNVTAGIIDYLQLYNYKKMFESTVKKAAGQAEPTVVSPRKYQVRFVSAMDRYFLSSGHPLLVPGVDPTKTAMTLIIEQNLEQEPEGRDSVIE